MKSPAAHSTHRSPSRGITVHDRWNMQHSASSLALRLRSCSIDLNQAQSGAAGARSSWFFDGLKNFDRIGSRRSGDLEGPATLASPEFRSLRLVTIISVLQAAMASGSPTVVAK